MDDKMYFELRLSDIRSYNFEQKFTHTQNSRRTMWKASKVKKSAAMITCSLTTSALVAITLALWCIKTISDSEASLNLRFRW
jgi:hypothetical protein